MVPGMASPFRALHSGHIAHEVWIRRDLEGVGLLQHVARLHGLARRRGQVRKHRPLADRVEDRGGRDDQELHARHDVHERLRDEAVAVHAPVQHLSAGTEPYDVDVLYVGEARRLDSGDERQQDLARRRQGVAGRWAVLLAVAVEGGVREPPVARVPHGRTRRRRVLQRAAIFEVREGESQDHGVPAADLVDGRPDHAVRSVGFIVVEEEDCAMNFVPSGPLPDRRPQGRRRESRIHGHRDAPRASETAHEMYMRGPLRVQLWASAVVHRRQLLLRRQLIGRRMSFRQGRRRRRGQRCR
mmetsp:Transcript_102651/g.257308  ORF Transcript_102651/g.257308 Transcript_102651/m.257308 type:complete len:299 (-) Transcript_102651:1034-1930(-)